MNVYSNHRQILYLEHDHECTAVFLEMYYNMNKLNIYLIYIIDFTHESNGY